VNLCLATRLAGGVGVYARSLISGLLAADPDIRIVVVSPDSMELPAKSAHRVSLRPMTTAWNPPTHPGWLVDAIAFRRAVRPLLSDVDLVHFPSDARHALFCTGLERPIVATMNDYFNAVVTWRPSSVRRYYEDWVPRYFAYHMARMAERRVLRRLPRIIGISDAVGAIVGPAYGIQQDRFRTVRYGLDFSVIPPNPGKLDAKTVLFVGGNFQRKGLLVLLRAAPRVLADSPETRFVIIGKSYYERGAKRLAERLRVAASCEFVGGVDYKTLVQHYATATVLTMPSLMEAFGIPYLEGMSCGLPVVATACRGPDEYLRNEENSLVVPPGDVEALATALIRLLRDTNLRARLREGGRRTASEFTPARMAQETLAVYRGALRGTGDSGGGLP